MRPLKESLRRLEKADVLRFLIFCYLLKLQEVLYLPPPLKFSVRAASFMMALLFIMPPHPLSIPATIGAGLSLALIIQ